VRRAASVAEGAGRYIPTSRYSAHPVTDQATASVTRVVAVTIAAVAAVSAPAAVANRVAARSPRR
jgi:hypothetical protein